MMLIIFHIIIAPGRRIVDILIVVYPRWSALVAFNVFLGNFTFLLGCDSFAGGAPFQIIASDVNE